MVVQSPERMPSRSRSASPAWGNDTHITIKGRPRTKSRSPAQGDAAAPAAVRLPSQPGPSRPLYGRRSSSGSTVNNYLLAPPPQRHGEISRKISSILGSKPPRGAAISSPIDYRYDQDEEGQWYDYDGESDSSSQGRGGGEREETPPDSPERAAVLHLDPLSPQDMTVHMSLPVGDDVEGVLEEFSRLRRLGRFSDALELFGKEQLGHLIDNRYVLLQYGQCLFEAGWVGELGRLAEQQATKAERDALGISWSLLKWMAEVETPALDEQRNILEAGIVMLRGRWPALDSTEMNILCAIVSQSTAFVGCFSPDDWAALYDHLADEGMVWEFRDLVQSIPLAHWAPLPNDGRSAQTGYGSGQRIGDRVPEQLFCRWSGDGDDLASFEESTLFALLDVSTTLCLLTMKEEDNEARAERWLGVARRHAAELTSRDEGHMVSRPYLRWVMAGVSKGDYRGSRCRSQYTFSGTLRQGNFAVSAKLFPFFTPVIYIPSADEAPEWEPLPQRPDAATVETVHAVLRAAEGSGDQRVQAGCLQELMRQRAYDADDAMRALHDLWTLAGDAPSRRLAHLFQYMLARGPEARERLRRDILVNGRFPNSSSLQYAQYMILRALSPKAWDKQHYETEAEQVRQYQSHWNLMLADLAAAQRRPPRGGVPPRRPGRAPAASRSTSEMRAGPRELAGFIECGPASVPAKGGAEAVFYAPQRGRSSGRTSRQKQGAESDRDSGFFDESIASPPPPRPGSAELPPILETSEPDEGPCSEREHDDRDKTRATSDSARAEAREAGPESRRNGRLNSQGDGIERGRRADRASERASSVESHRAGTGSVAGVDADGSDTSVDETAEK
ncbi:hypothetical protein RB595_003994 [Gaeumannomyces hyphopodioides]